MASQVEIVNRALNLLGANRITSMSDDTLEAELASSMYNQSLKSILSECRWSFATKRINLTRTTEEPAWQNDGMKYCFQLPADVIRIFEIADRTAFWRVEGEKVLSNNQTFGILYVYLMTDPTKFTASFIEAFANRLAYDMCYSITNSATYAKGLLETYRGQTLEDAMAEDSQIGTAIEVQDGYWALSKYSQSPLKGV